MSLRQDKETLYKELRKIMIIRELEAYIASDLLDKLREIPQEELKRKAKADARRFKRPATGAALQYGNLAALQYLFESGISLPDAPQSLRTHLESLFVKQGEHAPSNKDKDNLVQLFRYMRDHVCKEHPEWGDKDLGNHILIITARDADISHLHASLAAIYEVDLANNINAVDEKGMSAMGYLMLRSADPFIIEEMKKRGAVLSAADQHALKQKKFASDFSDAMIKKEKKATAQCVADLNGNPSLLTNEQLKNIIEQARLSDDVETTVALVDVAILKNTFTEGLDKISESIWDIGSVLKDFSHRIGVRGEVDGLKMEENYPEISTRLLFNSLNKYSQKEESYKPIRDAIAFIVALNMMQCTERSPFLFHRFLNEKPLSWPVLWQTDETSADTDIRRGNHIIGVSVLYNKKRNKTYIAFSNRGAESLKHFITKSAAESGDLLGEESGTIVYELDGTLEQSFFAALGNNKRLYCPEFTAILNKEMPNAKLIAFLPAETQGYATCSYVNLKRQAEASEFLSAVSEGQPVNEETKAAAYDKYKHFSVFDKQDACDQLIEWHKRLLSHSVLIFEKEKLEKLTAFMVKVIQYHHSSKNKEAELNSARALYAVLPGELKTQIADVFPQVALEPRSLNYSQTLFLRTDKVKKEPYLLGDIKNLSKYQKLIGYLRENNLLTDINKIRKIVFQADKIIIDTAIDEDIFLNLRDTIFQQQLGAKTEDDGDSFTFTITNPDELKCVMLGKKM
jgi:hypothetical protein